LFSGTKITVGGEEFVVPAISLGQLRNGLLAKLQAHDELIAAGKTFDAIAMRAEVILAALRRNYPDFSEEKLYDYLDMSNSTPLWLTILGVSGFVPGETSAATETKSGT